MKTYNIRNKLLLFLCFVTPSDTQIVIWCDDWSFI